MGEVKRSVATSCQQTLPCPVELSSLLCPFFPSCSYFHLSFLSLLSSLSFSPPPCLSLPHSFLCPLSTFPFSVKYNFLSNSFPSVCYFGDRVLCIPSYPQTCYVAEVEREFLVLLPPSIGMEPGVLCMLGTHTIK